MGPNFDQMKYCRSQTKFQHFINYWSRQVFKYIYQVLTVLLGYAKHLLLEYLIKNNNDIR